MIRDQTIGSARAEKHKKHITSRVTRNMLTALLASALTLPSLAAWGIESSPQQAAAKSGDMLPLPPIRYLDSMPWMNWTAPAPTLRIDTLMSPSVTPWGILQPPRDRTQTSPAFS
ncbi:hypothetical protein QA640_35000 [Bradyrhizobium sp. CB82]|uniref:hypothetical protein n=1 Tax=Bradyrhizobium sp. CB82 TaxID=3039159 RepID=UPI0024B19C14|nr:hypothetical protein [Bradyrhizobium sp. CB82]WFU39524.1 hypothetical protein QA640_35000 [Bradyrhizobium sp. CB82]